jgi:hypothetical protein
MRYSGKSKHNKGDEDFALEGFWPKTEMPS